MRIGVFDSGVGGLTVLRELVAAMPGEHFIYLGDTARVPYGTKSAETVRRYAVSVGRFLLSRASGPASRPASGPASGPAGGIDAADEDGALKVLVVACNTASSVALDDLRAELDIPVIGVIDPGAAAAARATRTKRVGVLATPATIASGAYRRAIERHDTEIDVTAVACPLFVPLAEEGWVDDDVARLVAARYLEPFRPGGSAADVDVVILGCTHYPLLAEVIREVLGPNRVIIDSARATAAVVREMMERNSPRRHGDTEGRGGVVFCVTDSPEGFLRVAGRFFGSSVVAVERVDLLGG